MTTTDTYMVSVGPPEEIEYHRQSLAHGAVGIALLAVERAATSHGSWIDAHHWLAAANSGGLTASTGSHLYYGAPALAFAITGAHQHHPDSYHSALTAVDDMTTTIVRARLLAAHARIDSGQPPALNEFDTIRGLAGLGAHLLRRDPTTPLLRDVLAYMVRLTEPIHDHGDDLPGWWTNLGPDGNPSSDFPGGHANSGMAHGIGGPLALLALTAIRGITVPHHYEAIGRIRAWLDQWQQTRHAGTWWPYWITRNELRTGQLEQRGPHRPSWCYGTPGLARSQQLAAIAIGDTVWKRHAETALADALTDPHQLGLLTDNSLCHGLSGAAHVARLAAADSTSPRLQRTAEQTAAAAARWHQLEPTARPLTAERKPGFLEGSAGTDLALRANRLSAAPVTNWDTCLLVNAPA